MEERQGRVSARTMGRIGTALYSTGFIIFGVSLAQIPYDRDTESHVTYAILFGCLAVLGWMLTGTDRKARDARFWNYRPDTSGTWLFGSFFTSFGIIAGAYTLLNWLEGKSVLDGSLVGLLVIEILAIVLGLYLLVRDKQTSTKLIQGGDTNIER